MPGTAAGTVRRKQRTVCSATSASDACFGHVVAREHHVRLQQHALERARAARSSSSNTASCARGGDVARALDRVVAVHQHLGLDDRHDARLLAQRGVAGERVGVGVDAVLATAAVGDRVDRAPLREARAELAVLGQALAQPVEALGDRLALGAGERLRAGVDLDAGDDPATRRAASGRACRRARSGGSSRRRGSRR